jgi:DNA-binding protein Fis
MKPVHFLSNSPQIEHIIKGLTFAKSLMVSSIIIGKPYTGKKSLVESIYPGAMYVDGRKHEELLGALMKYEEVVIYHFESISDMSMYNFANKRIIAISNASKSTTQIENKFAFIYYMPALEDRLEDIKLLMTGIVSQIKEELMISKEVKIDMEALDLSENIKSLKASIYRELVTADIDGDALEKLIYQYLDKRIEGNNAYREHIGIFERPLIRAGLDKYGSQLKLSSVLGLNRNTLRKKIHEHNLD